MCTTVFCTVHIIYVHNSILQSKNANVQAHNSILHSIYMTNVHVQNSILHTCQMCTTVFCAVHMINEHVQNSILHTEHMIFHTVHMIKFNVHVHSTILHSVHMTKAHRAVGAPSVCRSGLIFVQGFIKRLGTRRICLGRSQERNFGERRKSFKVPKWT